MHNRPKHTPLKIKIPKIKQHSNKNIKFNKMLPPIKHNLRFKTSCINCTISNYFVYRFKIGKTYYRDWQGYI